MLSGPHDKSFWDNLYSSQSRDRTTTPHVNLVAEAEDLSPGSALDVGTGDGTDAIWLAERGWRVVGVDISSVALERAVAETDRIGQPISDRITWRQADLTEWSPPTETFDLVSAQYFHLPSAQRLPTYRALAAAVAPGGLLLMVGHHPSDLQTTAMRMPDPDPLFTGDDIVAELGVGWQIVTNEKRPRVEKDRTRQPITVHDTVVLARRTS